MLNSSPLRSPATSVAEVARGFGGADISAASQALELSMRVGLLALIALALGFCAKLLIALSIL